MDGFDGLSIGLGNLARLSRARTRSISPENFSGQPGMGGMATEGTGARAARDLGQGWKISPSVSIGAGETCVLASIDGPGAIQSMWFTGRGLGRDTILRVHWDGQAQPAIECPLLDFFAAGWGLLGLSRMLQ